MQVIMASKFHGENLSAMLRVHHICDEDDDDDGQASLPSGWHRASCSRIIKSIMLVTEIVPSLISQFSFDDSKANELSQFISGQCDQHNDSNSIQQPKSQTYLENAQHAMHQQQKLCDCSKLDQPTTRGEKVINHSSRYNSNLNKCLHHRTKTKAAESYVADESAQQHQPSRFNKSFDGRVRGKKPMFVLSSMKGVVRWTLIQVAIIYILLTSRSFKDAQASKTANNYWPLVQQHRYQQLFFTGRMQTHLNNDNNKEANGANFATATVAPISERRFLNPLRHNSQHTAAVAAAAAAMAATADAALARKSQSHNLMIGQKYNNFSSIIPYSLMQDVDYSQIQEDQIINEPSNDASGDSNLDSQHQVGLNDELKMSDSISELDSVPLTALKANPQSKVAASDRALLPLDSNRLMLPQMQQIKARFNQGCVGGTKCQFFAFCWMSGGSLGASCGLLMTCCVTPSRQEIQPGFYGPVVNDPYCGRSTSKINRIVGGTDASFGQFPWQAFVQVGGSRCGGALISSRHVVTAGHCVARSQHSPSSIKVTLGDYILNSDIESIPHEVYSVVEVLLHPNFRFTPQADRYDVAVLELDRTASYKDNIKPICLPQKDATFVGRVAYVAGWGALQAGSKLRPKVLQHVAVPVIENHVCESWHRRKGIDIRIYDEMMCAGYELGQRDACQGDSGGPLMLNQFGVWYLVGIVSAGYSCAKQYQPGIYHRVSSSSDWISSNVYQQGSSK